MDKNFEGALLRTSKMPNTPLITSIEDLPPALAASLSAEERELIQKLKGSPFRFAVTPHFASLAAPERDDPIRRQFIPDPLEEAADPFALDDPLGEERYRLTSRLVHQYSDRALLLAGGTCAGYCRHCFRRARMSAAFISSAELEPVLACLASRPGIREILVSGGDPLAADNGKLEELFGKLRKARPGILIRLCSRVPVTFPERLSQDAIDLFRRFKPLRLVTHINHPKELSPDAQRVLASLVEAGLPVHVQTVLLKGINDSAETLALLFRECLNLGLSPYYLFQLDLAHGTSHFRVPLRKGLAIYKELERQISGLALPVYAVDLPGGGGKIRLSEDIIAGEEGEVLLLNGHDGKLWKYPAR
jgi:lysine 2,3-aminomutase